MLAVSDVGPEATEAASFLSTGEDFHRRIIGPHYRRLQHQPPLQFEERLKQLRRSGHPVAHRTPGNVQSMAHEDVFLTIERQMVTKFADHDLSNQSGTGDARAIGRSGGGGLDTPFLQ
jgi:hypothetical protein